MSVRSIWENKPPVTYRLLIEQHPATGVTAYVEGISDDDRSKSSALWALAEAASHNMTSEQIHAAMLSRINYLMDATAPNEVAELRRLAEACQAYEGAS